MDKVPEHLRLPSKLLRLKHTPDGRLLWRKVFFDISNEAKEAERIREDIDNSKQ